MLACEIRSPVVPLCARSADTLLRAVNRMRCANGHRDNRWPPHAFATAPAELLRRVAATDDRSALIAAAAIPHDRLGVPRTAREIAVLLPLARQTALPKRLHDVHDEPDALRPTAPAPRPHNFRALAAAVHHATARLDPLSATGGASKASAARAAARGRSAAATRTTMPSAARQTVPSGPSRSNAKSRTPWGLRNSPVARFIACSFVSWLLDRRRKKTKARRRLSLGCRALALEEERQCALSVFPLGGRPARNGQSAILVPPESARHRDVTAGECRPTPRGSWLALGHLHHRQLLRRHASRAGSRPRARDDSPLITGRKPPNREAMRPSDSFRPTTRRNVFRSGDLRCLDYVGSRRRLLPKPVAPSAAAREYPRGGVPGAHRSNRRHAVHVLGARLQSIKTCTASLPLTAGAAQAFLPRTRSGAGRNATPRRACSAVTRRKPTERPRRPVATASGF